MRHLIPLVAIVISLYAQNEYDYLHIGDTGAVIYKMYGESEKVAVIPAMMRATLLDSREFGGQKWYRVDYYGKIGWVEGAQVSSFSKAYVPTATSPKDKPASSVAAPIEKPTSSVCDVKGIRGREFGMTFEEARAVDLDWAFQDTFVVAYLSDTSSYDALLTHKYSLLNTPVIGVVTTYDGMVYSVGNVFEPKTTRSQKYVELYFEIKSVLTKKYGKPSQHNETLTGLYDDESVRGKRAGQAISMGYGSYLSVWRCPTNQVSIQLFLTGDNYESTLYLHYADGALKQPTSEREKEVLDEF